VYTEPDPGSHPFTMLGSNVLSYYLAFGDRFGISQPSSLNSHLLEEVV
jgi:hypothetical protein